MTKIKKIIMLFIILSICITPKYAIAQDMKYINNINTTYKSHQVQILIYDFNSHLDQIYSGKTLNQYAIKAQNVGDDLYFHTLVKWENPNYVIQNGNQEINIILYTYEGKVTIPISIYGNEEPITTNNDNLTNVDEELVTGEITNTAPSLLATSLLMESTSTTYDLNLADKIEGSTYFWTSSDTSVATVDSKNGLVTAKKNGKTKITCEVTTPDNNNYTLVADVNIGLDDNATILSDSELDLEVGDKADIDVENKISNSTYKWKTSDKKVVKVNSSNGKIQAVGKGSAKVTCIITTQKKQVIVLTCNVNVDVE